LFYGWGGDTKVKNNVTVAISELRDFVSNKSDFKIAMIHGKGYLMPSINNGTHK
jgi:DNA-binding winged helix-turn-helix (wHTH) protein